MNVDENSEDKHFWTYKVPEGYMWLSSAAEEHDKHILTWPMIHYSLPTFKDKTTWYKISMYM